MFARKVLKNIKKLEDIDPRIAKPEETGIVREYVCFIIKAFTESFQSLSRVDCKTEFQNFMIEEKEILF